MIDLVSAASILYLVLPFVAAALGAFLLRKPRSMQVLGMTLSVLHVLALLPVLSEVLLQHAPFLLEAGYIEQFNVYFSTSWTKHSTLFLLVVDVCFFFSYLMGRDEKQTDRLCNWLLILFHGTLVLYVVSGNLLLIFGLQILVALLLYYMIRFSLLSAPKKLAEKISNNMTMIYASLAGLGIVWAIAELGFGASESIPALVLHASTHANHSIVVLWLISLVFTVPLAPWASWFNHAVEELPAGIVVAVIAFLSAVVMHQAEIYLTTYPDLLFKYKVLIYILGLVGCFFSLAALYKESSRRAMLACLPKFFLSLVLVAIAVVNGKHTGAIYLLCYFIPIFGVFAVYVSELNFTSVYQNIFLGIFLLVLFGVPGSPVYQILSLICMRAIDMGLVYALFFAMVWFFYFHANAFLCRRMLLDLKTKETDATITTREPVLLSIYMFLLLLFLGLVVLVDRGLL